MTKRDPALEPEPRDAGVSLVEVLVGVGLFAMLGVLLLGLALSTGKVTSDTRALANVSEESRLAMERMTRELRQSSGLTAVQLPGSSTSLTFWTDFNGNGAPDLNAADPEVLTYRLDPATSTLTLTANDATGTAITRPVLAAHVSQFTVDLRSSKWQYDTPVNAVTDGVTTWQEIDAAAAPVGNGNGRPDGQELAHLDLVQISMTVLDGARAQTYETKVDLRNRN
jgi:type II secretory pathway pseudopilin PulG